MFTSTIILGAHHRKTILEQSRKENGNFEERASLLGLVYYSDEVSSEIDGVIAPLHHSFQTRFSRQRGG